MRDKKHSVGVVANPSEVFVAIRIGEKEKKLLGVILDRIEGIYDHPVANAIGCCKGIANLENGTGVIAVVMYRNTHRDRSKKPKIIFTITPNGKTIADPDYDLSVICHKENPNGDRRG